MNDEHLLIKRTIVGRLVFLLFFIALVLRFCMQVTPSNMLQPVLYRYNFDFSYWILDLLNVFEVVLRSSVGSVVFDFLLFSSCLLCFLYPLKNHFAILFGLLFFIYVTAYNATIVHHSHPLALMSLATIPFFSKNIRSWNFLWLGFRYYVCYAYVMTFIWKAFIGKSLFHNNMGLASVKLNLVEYVYHFPTTTMSSVYKFFIAHPPLLNYGLILIYSLEAFMFIGFFTKKWDSFLLLIPIIIHLSTYFFSDVYFLEMLIGVLPFLSVAFINGIHNLRNSKHTR